MNEKIHRKWDIRTKSWVFNVPDGQVYAYSAAFSGTTKAQAGMVFNKYKQSKQRRKPITSKDYDVMKTGSARVPSYLGPHPYGSYETRTTQVVVNGKVYKRSERWMKDSCLARTRLNTLRRERAERLGL